MFINKKQWKPLFYAHFYSKTVNFESAYLQNYKYHDSETFKIIYSGWSDQKFIVQKIFELHYTVPLSLLIFSDEPQDQTDLNLSINRISSSSTLLLLLLSISITQSVNNYIVGIYQLLDWVNTVKPVHSKHRQSQNKLSP